MRIKDTGDGQEYEVIVCKSNDHVVIRTQEQTKGSVFPPMCADRWNQDMYVRFWVVNISWQDIKTLLDAHFNLTYKDGKTITYEYPINIR